MTDKQSPCFIMDDYTSGEEEYSSSDRDSLDGLENDEPAFQWVPPKGPSTKVIDLLIFLPARMVVHEALK